MGRKRMPKKDKFDDLPEGFQEAVQQSTTDDIRKRVADIAILDCKERAILKGDPEVLMAKDQLKNLMEPYRENLRSYKLQIEYCNRALDDKGGGQTVSRGTFAEKVEELFKEAGIPADKIQRNVSVPIKK